MGFVGDSLTSRDEAWEGPVPSVVYLSAFGPPRMGKELTRLRVRPLPRPDPRPYLTSHSHTADQGDAGGSWTRWNRRPTAKVLTSAAMKIAG